MNRIQCKEYDTQNTIHRIKYIEYNFSDVYKEFKFKFKYMYRIQCIEYNADNTMHRIHAE